MFRRRDHRDKQDVYDYGAILLEIVLGRPPTIRNPFPQKRSELVMNSLTLLSLQYYLESNPFSFNLWCSCLQGTLS